MRAAGGPALPQGHSAYRLVVSPADPSTVMVATSAGVFVTRNGGDRFDSVMPSGAWLSADPVDPTRWYAIDAGRALVGTTDAGAHWVSLTSPSVLSGQFDLLVDTHDARKLYAVGTHGDVSLSMDRGLTWAVVVPPSLSLALAPASTRIGPEPVTTLYAASAQGAVKIAIAAVTAPAVVRVVEYFRPEVSHFFMTADPQEIALLDSGATAGWIRTGFGFNVLAATASVAYVSPVCRFYGKPEKGLDSHFYSASPAECQSVRDRFSDSWIYESPAVFHTYLPTPSEGTCPSGTTPVYRLYNKRADVNHRYTMWPELRQNMLDLGWIAEGYGPFGVAMCAPWLP